MVANSRASCTFVSSCSLSRGIYLSIVRIDGGGWVLGSKGSELHQCTNFCVRARCVVVTVDCRLPSLYVHGALIKLIDRLAPEDPFPAAVEDCWEALQWIIEDARAEDGGVLGIDDTRMWVCLMSANSHNVDTPSVLWEEHQLEEILPLFSRTCYYPLPMRLRTSISKSY
jgi:hypothetical protein